MRQLLIQWYNKYLSKPEALMLLISIVVILLVILFMGRMLAPAIVSLVLAYLLQSVVAFLERCKVPHGFAVIVVFVLFLGLVVLTLFGLMPTLWQQISNFVHEIPNMLNQVQALLMRLPQNYPDYISVDQVQHVIAESKSQFAQFGQLVLSFSISSIPGIIALIVYLVLVPLLIYFFLMDKALLVNWFRQFLPEDRRLILQVWKEVNEQIGNYIGGKITETIIVGVVTYITFALMSMPYAVLLAAIVGLSVIIPYIGAVLATIPVVIIALVEWGLSSHFFYLILAYTIIITLDANVLVPVLFSEVMDLHPVAIIMAILIFGGFWGFWGIFFAIPLATVVKAVLTAWPKTASKLE